MHFDPYILAFSAITVVLTIGMGFWAAKKSKTAHDFFVAGRSVSVGWNASAISGEYLSAASFMGIAGMVMSSGYDALWYPVCYACGYLFLLLFIAGPLRRFGAYTIPDFAEGRFDSPLFRKIAVIFVLFIGFFYTMPQMKGAGTTLAYIFPGLPYWAGVVVVGVVITLNVALGGMKGITLVQAFQYWIKVFAISVPVFVLMAVYGHYGKQVGVNQRQTGAYAVGSPAEVRKPLPAKAPADPAWLSPFGPLTTKAAKAAAAALTRKLEQPNKLPLRSELSPQEHITVDPGKTNISDCFVMYGDLTGRRLWPGGYTLLERLNWALGSRPARLGLVRRSQLREVDSGIRYHRDGQFSVGEIKERLEKTFADRGINVIPEGKTYFRAEQLPTEPEQRKKC